jgi:Subtilase family
MTKQDNRVSAMGATARILGIVALLCPVGFAAHGADLIIYALSSDPSVLPTTATDGSDDDFVSVVFNTVVAGTSEPPERLTLEQLESGEFRPVELPNGDDVFLLDDGEGDDDLAGDLVYTAKVDINRSEDSRNIYRATLPSGETSPEYLFEIADAEEFQNPLVPGDDVIVEDPETGQRFVDGEVLVRFRSNVRPEEMVGILDQDSESMAGWDGILDVAKIELAPGEDVLDHAARLESNPEVESAEPNHVLELDGLFANDGELDELENQRSLKIVGARAAWVAAGPLKERNRRNIAVLDSGINLGKFAEVLVDEDASVLASGCSGEALEDENGHGTAVAGIAAAAADAELLPIRVTTGTGTRTNVGILICALGEVAKNRALVRIVNISMGFDNLAQANKSQLLDRIKSLIKESGMLVVASAGNGTRNNGSFEENHYPATFNEDVGGGLIAVANTNNSDRPHNADNEGTRRGPWVDLSAPGVKVRSLKFDGLEGEVGSFTGTSMSAALVSGAASLLWSRHPRATPGEIERWLKDGAKSFAVDQGLGAGRLDMAGATLNGSMELVAPPDKGPASWPSKKGTCKVVRGAAGDFYAPRHGTRFVRCKGEAGLARTQKVIEVPPGTTRLKFAVKIAAFADALSDTVKLRVLFKPGGDRWERTLGINSVNCDGFGAASNTRCTGWKTAGLSILNPPAGKSQLVFDAQDPNGRAISLMLDKLEVTVEVP